jgi:putative glutamine amidotransferase
MSDTVYKINKAYVEYVAEAGFNPVLVTPEAMEEETEFILLGCDGLLLPGGIDIDPTFYGDENIASLSVDPKKDDFERELFHHFLNQNKPIFGICRGFQLIVREWLRGNTDLAQYFYYCQHINKHAQTDNLGLARDVRSHSVRYLPSKLYGIEDGETVAKKFVNSMHHQCLIAHDPAHPNTVQFGNLHIAALTRRGLDDIDGYIVEAVRFNWGGSAILAVQWHPEELRDNGLLEYIYGGQAESEVHGNTQGA